MTKKRMVERFKELGVTSLFEGTLFVRKTNDLGFTHTKVIGIDKFGECVTFIYHGDKLFSVIGNACVFDIESMKKLFQEVN